MDAHRRPITDVVDEIVFKDPVKLLSADEPGMNEAPFQFAEFGRLSYSGSISALFVRRKRYSFCQ